MRAFELLLDDRRSPSTTVLTIGDERPPPWPSAGVITSQLLHCHVQLWWRRADSIPVHAVGPARPSGAWRKKTCLRCLRYQRLQALLRVPVMHTF